MHDAGAQSRIREGFEHGIPTRHGEPSQIAFDAETFVAWQAIGYDSGSAEQPFLLEPVLELRFDRSQYVNLLTSVLDTVDGPGH